MPLGTANETITYFTLVTSDDMYELIKVLPTINYRGDLSVWKDDAGNPLWSLVINDNNPVPKQYQLNLIAELGKVVIWDNVDIQVITNDEFLEHFTPIT